MHRLTHNLALFGILTLVSCSSDSALAAFAAQCSASANAQHGGLCNCADGRDADGEMR